MLLVACMGSSNDRSCCVVDVVLLVSATLLAL
jgi:hypothetical protein